MTTNEKQILFESLQLIFQSLLNKKKMDFDKVMNLYGQINSVLEGMEKNADN